MAELSKITVPDGTVYDIKDAVARAYHEPIDTRTYTNVIATSNDNVGAGFFYLKVTPDDFYYSRWRIKVRVKATVNGTGAQQYYDTDTLFHVWGSQATVYGYICENKILNTSYRPIYYNSVFLTNATGYINGCSHWIGFNLWYSTNPTSTSYYRNVKVELLEYEECKAELQDSLITPTNIPNWASHTNWYASTNTSFSNYDACSNGIKQSGDNNTTTIHALMRNSGNYIADSALYRYQLLFHVDEDRLTPLNNVNNGYGSTTKAMLTNVEFDPFKPIYCYSTTTNVPANSSIGAGSLYWHIAGVDLRYTFNMTTSSLTAHKPLYLVVTPTTGSMCKLASATPWSQTLPSTDDGNWYVLLGRTYSGYQMTLYDDHPVYMYDGTNVVRVLSYSKTDAGLKEIREYPELTPGPSTEQELNTMLTDVLESMDFNSAKRFKFIPEDHFSIFTPTAGYICVMSKANSDDYGQVFITTAGGSVVLNGSLQNGTWTFTEFVLGGDQKIVSTIQGHPSTTIPSGSLLSNYKTPGLFYITSSSIAASISDCPVKTAGGRLEVMGINSDTQFLKQFYYPSGSASEFYIRSQGSNGTFGSWYKFTGTAV